MIIQPARRTESVQEYYFSRKLKEIAAMNASREASGAEPVINLGIGSPDGMPPMQAIDALCDSARQSGNHAYQSYVGLPALRNAFSRWYERWYGVNLNPDTQIQPLVGSKEGILLISLAFLNKGDKVLVPDPGYPTYSSASRLVEAEIVTYDLSEDNGWQPDFDALEKMDLDGVKIMWTNYPNMPTGASASEELYDRLVDFGRRHSIMICNDNPYSFILNDKPLSILAREGAMDCCLELNSLSKAHNMAGWRIGMVAAEAEVISQILKVKSQMDSGMFKPLQMAAVQALAQGPEWFGALNDEYRQRRKLAGDIFDLIGAEYDHDSSGMFLWGKITSCSLLNGGQKETGKIGGEIVSDAILQGCGVFITPGFIFGKNGDNYIRISLCAKPQVLRQAYDRINKLLK
ncbi:MAG: aminotransferase class I/II-fold pyridoxal phosphate-dependent enzyme [Candidatus Cryptobacteroides sp.]|nr:aminotransferase class I/II-fold pyridoxal phosphate-dependent enzyme [Candidatus Cryptobacteroides sp.]